MSDEEAARRGYSVEQLQRASQDAKELLGHLQRCQNQGLVHGTLEQQENTARHLVTWGWTRIGPGEQVVARPTPRNEELSQRDELAATIAAVRANDGNLVQPVALAEYLIGDGWTKLGPGEKVVTPLSREDAFRIVAEAFAQWEELNETARKEWPQGPAVSADSSELTAPVKTEDRETRILHVFATAPRAFSRAEALTLAAGKDTYGVDRLWTPWDHTFYALQEQDLLELAPGQQPGSERTYQLTDAGRIALATKLRT